jgi:hypothetical protein
MANDPPVNHGEGNPETAKEFNDAEQRYVASARGQEAIRKGAAVLPEQEAELREAERLGKARAQGV